MTIEQTTEIDECFARLARHLVEVQLSPQNGEGYIGRTLSEKEREGFRYRLKVGCYGFNRLNS
jgi:hypothetical protein